LSRVPLRPHAADKALALVTGANDVRRNINTAAMIARLQATMADNVGPLRTGAKLERALKDIAALAAELGDRPPRFGADVTAVEPFDLQRLEWFDLRNMITVAHAVAAAALARTESRGAHQREDFEKMSPQWHVHQSIRMAEGALHFDGAPHRAEALAT
jgi:succinate dehydrogenase/fumarate reductase flavoprotein subunit